MTVTTISEVKRQTWNSIFNSGYRKDYFLKYIKKPYKWIQKQANNLIEKWANTRYRQLTGKETN